MPASTLTSAPRSANAGVSWLLLLFIGSGCSALIYEITWFQTLQLFVGSSAISLGVLLATFMGGMCAGSWAFARIVSPHWHPLRVYALLELLIGVCAVGLWWGAPLAERIYIENVGGGAAGVALRALVAAACLLPPTILMGATLPAISRWMESSPAGVSRIGLFYGANILGAVFGCLSAAFYLLRVYDLTTATWTAVAINAAVAIASLVLAWLLPYDRSLNDPPASPAATGAPRYAPYAAIAASGFAALGAEVVWTRDLSLLLGATVYTFAIILAVFLIGLGIGSGLGSGWARQTAQPWRALAFCQIGAAASAAWASWMLSVSLPYWPIDPGLSWSPWFGFQLDMARCLWTVLPAAICWGASFPLALAAAARGQDPARLVGGVYAANTLGAILGAVYFSLAAIPLFGVQIAEQTLISTSLGSALVMLIVGRKTAGPAGQAGWLLSGGQISAAVATIVLGGAVVATLPAAPPGVAAYGRYLVTMVDEPLYLFHGEGMNASIAVSQFDDGTRNFHVSGKVVASSEPQDMKLQRMLGHLPALLLAQPKSVLIVGCGAGVTAGCFVAHPSIERIVICEIEPLIPKTAGVFFGEENHFVMDDPRVEVVFDDARHFLATTREKFDIITSDPIHPWVKGAAALYSREYYKICLDHLNPGGIVTQWVPLYESSLDAVKSEFVTFFDVFPFGTVWSNDAAGLGYDIVLLGQVEPTRIDIDALQDRLDREDHAKVLKSLDEVEMGSALALLKKFAVRRADLTPWLVDAQLNTDRNLRLQYLAGMGLNAFEAELIYDNFIEYRRFPDGLFFASAERISALRTLLQATDDSSD